jgi:hypothetical protein
MVTREVREVPGTAAGQILEKLWPVWVRLS